jgi:hypothetical protein
VGINLVIDRYDLQDSAGIVYILIRFIYTALRCRMYKKGDKVVLKQPIEGKKDRFEEGLKGTIVETFDLAHGKSYRVQFVDGRVARFPEELMKQAVEVMG